MKTERCYYTQDKGELYGEIVGLKPFTLDGKKLTAAVMDRTIFYPEGGGQPGDRGTINGVPVLDTREEAGEVLHLVDPTDGKGLRHGPARLVLDARRRRDFTLHHTAQHLLAGTVLRLTGKPTVSMHLGDEVCAIDVDGQDLGEEAVAAAEDEVMAAIEEDAPVIIHLCPPEDAGAFPLRKRPPQGEEVIRVVEIRGHDFSPCCGTHLASTGAIGMLRVLGAEKYKGMTRISFIAGRRCLADSRLLRRNCEAISHRLSVPVPETAAGVEALAARAASLEARVKALEEEAALSAARALVGKAPTAGGLILESYSDLSIDEARRVGKAAQRLTDKVLVLASVKDCRFAAFCGDKAVDLRPLAAPFLEARGGKGGGGGGFFQGSLPNPAALAGFMADLAGAA